jgi:hypothetical protein
LSVAGGNGDEPGLEPLRCPHCDARYPAQARFCEACRLPLIPDESEKPGSARRAEQHDRARKIKPQLTEGPLTFVVRASNQVEAEFIQGLLLEEGVPSMTKRSAGFDVPDFLAGGPRDVLVPGAAAEIAREALLAAEIDPAAPVGPPVTVVRLAIGLLTALAIGVAVIWLIWH